MHLVGPQLGHKKVDDADKDEKIDLCEEDKRGGVGVILRTSCVLHGPPVPDTGEAAAG